MGRSTRLGCADQEADASEGGFAIAPSEWEACVKSLEREWGADMGAFSTTFAAQLLLSFLKDPTTRPAGDCLDGILPIDFDVPADLANAILGTPDAWGNP
jgi:hypothetical protein